MRVILLHNPNAGDGEWSARSLKSLFARHGHEVIYASTKAGKWEAALAERARAVAIGGGDGTVDLVALRVAQRKLPLCLLPLGTANNIASSLGFDRPVEEIVASLGRAKRRKLDLGTVSSCQGSRAFMEGVGAGLLAEMMREGPQGPETGSPAKRVRKARKRLISMLDEYKGTECELWCDGKKKKGRFLVVEIMNTGRIGPGLNFAPRADPGDGLLEVVCVTMRERAKLRNYLKELMADDHAPLPFRARRCRRAELRCPDGHLHVDDEEFDVPSAEIGLRASALQFLDGLA